MASVLTVFGAIFGLIGTGALLMGHGVAGFCAWTAAAVFLVGGALVQELRDRIPRLPAPKGPGDLNPRESWVSRIFG